VITLFLLPFMIITTSVAGPHHFYAPPAPIKNFDVATEPAALDPAALDPAAPAPTLLYS
jgi:hypothetical protein